MESYNTFERLFKTAITENTEGADDNATMNFEVPTSSEDMVDEIEDTQDEVSDLVSDIKDVVSKLNDILSKIEDEGSEGEEEEGEDESPEDEFNYEEGEDSEEGEDEDEQTNSGVKESIDKPKPLNNSKGATLMSKKNKVGRLSAKGGSAHTGKFRSEAAPKKLTASDKDLRNTKNQKVKTSNIKTGDFFR